MYQLINAVGVMLDVEGEYQPIDLTSMPLNTVFTTYAKVIATVSRSTDNTEWFLDLYKLPVGVRLLNHSLPQYLLNNGNRTLPVEPVRAIEYDYARFYDLWERDFDAKLVNRNLHPDYELSEDQKTDLLLSKSFVDYPEIVRNHLFTVNGFVHRAEFLPQGVLVYDAVVSKRISNNTHLGAIDFSAFNGLSIVPITKEMVYERNVGQPYAQAVYVRLPRPIGATTPLLVLGGYLHALDDLYSMVSDSVIRIDFSRYPWIQRYFTLRNQLDLSSLGIEAKSNGAYDIDSMATNAVIEALLTLTQSFVVLVNSTELNRRTEPLHYAGLPGVYECGTKPLGPIVIDDGRFAEYAISTESGRYALRVENYLTDRRVLETTHYQAYQSTAPLNVSEKPYAIADAHFLLLSKAIGG